jgi:25S rRNA (uracil2634-N3)-methyltransferase
VYVEVMVNSEAGLGCLFCRSSASEPNNAFLLLSRAMAKGKKSSLRSTLQSQQSRLKNKQKAEHAAQVAEQNGKKKGKGKAPPPRSTVPFKPTDRILLIGEGNFSFARALTLNIPSSLEDLPPGNVTATAYDAEDDCYVKYPDAQIIVQGLREKGVEVLFNVDATKLEKVSALKGRRWDRIVWNFPHAGEHRLGFIDTR